ncbi:MAG: LamG domain protein jellyroll fold domain protein [Verrucomicrobiales bacterium]|nr:LamG domain protein jellyroll fold domain protein [Verrucomicrobiales bacterium]
MEAWLKPAVENAAGTLTCALSSGRFGDPRTGWLIYQSDTGWNFRTYYNSGLATAVNIAVEAPPVAGTWWYHVVATWNGTVGKIYVDGAASEEGLPSDPENPYVPPASGSFRFGARADNAFL